MPQNRPLAGSWNARPGNWRIRADQAQPSFRNTKSNTRDQTLGISGRVELAKIKHARHIPEGFADPMLETPIGQNALRREANAARRRRMGS